MNSTYKLAAILLGSVLLAQPRVQASEKMSDIRNTASCVVAYCPNIHCWQKAPCLVEHQTDVAQLPKNQASIQPAKATSKVVFPSSIIVARFPAPFGRDRDDARYWAPIVWSPT